MDYVDWATDIAGGALALLIIVAGFSRLSGSVERDISPLWRLGFIASGGTLATALVFGWIFPAETIVYVANGSGVPRQVRIGDEVICLPGKSYQDFTWRLSPPDAVVVGGAEREQRYAIGKGSWFINTAPATVSADMYTDSAGIAFDAFTYKTSGAIRIDSHYGRPMRMFSQSSFNRVYSMDGDVMRRSASGPCANSAVAAAPAAEGAAASPDQGAAR